MLKNECLNIMATVGLIMLSVTFCSKAAACGLDPNADQLNLTPVVLMVPKQSPFQFVIGARIREFRVISIYAPNNYFLRQFVFKIPLLR